MYQTFDQSKWTIGFKDENILPQEGDLPWVPICSWVRRTCTAPDVWWSPPWCTAHKSCATSCPLDSSSDSPQRSTKTTSLSPCSLKPTLFFPSRSINVIKIRSFWVIKFKDSDSEHLIRFVEHPIPEFTNQKLAYIIGSVSSSICAVAAKLCNKEAVSKLRDQEVRWEFLSIFP